MAGRGRYRRRRSYGGGRRFRGFRGVGSRMVVVRRAGGAALSRLRGEAARTKDRVIAAMIAGGYGVGERNDMFSSIPALFDDPAHTIALASAAIAMVAKGSIRTIVDHIANAMVPISAYKLGKNGFDPGGDGFLAGVAGDLEEEG